jgi:hypothetical protein
MIRRIGYGLLWAVAGYVAGAVIGGVLVTVLSSNRFDRSMEAAMTGAFVTGPLLAVAAFIAGMWWAGAGRRGGT